MIDTTHKSRFYQKFEPEPNSGCWLWTASVCGGGYGQMGVNRKTTQAHRLSWQIHYGPIPAGKVVMHKCDVPSCVNPDHLRIGSQAENVKDRDEKMRRAAPVGVRNPNARLCETAVAHIKKAQMSQRKLARLYNISQAHVSRIQNGVSWVAVNA